MTTRSGARPTPSDTLPPPPPRTGQVTSDRRDPDPDQAWKALGFVNDWVRHAEAKTGATLAAAGVTGGVLYNLVKDQKNPSAWLSLLAALCGIAIVASALSAVIALIPQLKIPKTNTKAIPLEGSGDDVAPQRDPASLLFFAHITRDYKGDAPTYAQVLKTLTSDNDQLTEQIARQIHANAHVAQRKYRWTNAAIIALAIDLLFLAGTAVLLAHH